MGRRMRMREKEKGGEGNKYSHAVGGRCTNRASMCLEEEGKGMGMGLKMRMHFGCREIY